MNMRTMRSKQEGVMLLEALIGILIFSLGVLALVAMQAVSVSAVSNARFRTEAAFLADDIIGQAWTDRGFCPPAPAVCISPLDGYRYPGGGAGALVGWVQKVRATLPSSDVYPPTIEVTPMANPTSGRQITVTVQWRAPDAVMTSRHVAVGYVVDPQP
jgi:type IV pilus assembly protein PilV